MYSNMEASDNFSKNYLGRKTEAGFRRAEEREGGEEMNLLILQISA